MRIIYRKFNRNLKYVIFEFAVKNLSDLVSSSLCGKTYFDISTKYL